MIIVRAFYRFLRLENLTELREALKKSMIEGRILGTILIAPEGINGTISGTEEEMQTFWNQLKFAEPLEFKQAQHSEQPFLRTKVKIKPEIITIRADGTDPSVHVGNYVEPKNWNEIISDPETIVIDTRNDYEVVEGTFKGAINPKMWSFSEFPAWVEANLDANKDKKIAMFCTGGIRCEKASALLLSKGFEAVYHLKGGILQYLEDVSEDQSLYEGSCLVFDDRGAVAHQNQPVDRRFDQLNLPEDKRASKRFLSNENKE